MVKSWFIHTSKNPASRAKRSEVRGSGTVKRAKTTKTSRRARERKIEWGRKANGRNERKGGRTKIEVHCGPRFFVLSASTSGGRLRGKFHIRFSSSNQFQKLDYFSPSQSFAARGRSRGLLHSCLYISICRWSLSRTEINIILDRRATSVPAGV